MLRLGGIQIRTNAHTASEGNARHEVSDQSVLLLHDVHVEELREGLDVQDGDDVWVDSGEQGEGGWHVGAEHGALAFLYPLPEERLRPLEPEVIEPVRDWTQHRPPVPARDRPHRTWRWLGYGRGCAHHFGHSFEF